MMPLLPLTTYITHLFHFPKELPMSRRNPLQQRTGGARCTIGGSIVCEPSERH